MDMGEYYSEIKEVALEGFKRLNGSDHVEHKKWDVPVGSWEVSVVRGKVLEKATVARVRLTVTIPDSGEEMRVDCVQANVYPASPKIPILLVNQENRVGKQDSFGGFVDVAAVAACEEDLSFLSTEMKKVAERHGEDYETRRKGLESIYKMDQWERAVNAAVGMRMESPKEKFDLVRDAGLQWFRSYLAVVEKRQNESYDKKDVAVMDSVRARILEYYLLGDMATGVGMKLGVPLEAMTLSILAPTVRY
jgi:coproporphyrinogen III oxidase